MWPNRAVLAAIGMVAGTTAAFSLVTIGRAKDAFIAGTLAGQYVGARDVLGALGGADLVLGLLAAIAVGWLVWLEMRYRAGTRLLVGATPPEGWVLLTILVAWFGHAYLGRGILLGGDTATHVTRFLEVSRGLDQGRLALWTNYQYGGAPLLWFTGPLTYVVGGLLAFVLRDAVMTLKILLFGLTLASGWLFHAFLRRLGLRVMPSVVGAVAFAGSFAHLHMFLYRGVAPQAFTIAFLVMLFLSADGLMRGVGSRWSNMSIFGLATAASIVNHQPHALFAAAYLAVFGAVALLTGFWRWSGLRILLVAGVLGAVASLIAVVPILAEADWVMIEPDEAALRLRLPTPERLRKLLLWGNSSVAWGSDYWAYLGLGPIAFAVAGAAALVSGRVRRGPALPALACLAVSLVLYNPVVRDIMFVLFFVALLAAIGADWLQDRVAAFSGLAGRGPVLLVSIALLDLASTAVQPVTRTDKTFLIDAGRRLEQLAPNERVMQVTTGPGGVLVADTGPNGIAAGYDAMVQRVAGNHNMGATRLHNILFATTKLVQAELSAVGALSATTRAMLGMLNATRIICSTASVNGCPATYPGTQHDTVLGRFLQLEAAPALFSQRLAALPMVAGLDKPALWATDYLGPGKLPRVVAVEDAIAAFVGLEAPDFKARRAAVIALHGVPPVQSDGPAQAGWDAALQDYEVGLDRVTMRVAANGPGWVQLAHPWFPSTRVTMNGERVVPLRGALNLIVLPVSAGSTVIELRDGWTTVRLLSSLASLAGLAAILAFAIVLGLKDRARRPL